jgi:hypothetical protein
MTASSRRHELDQRPSASTGVLTSLGSSRANEVIERPAAQGIPFEPAAAS